jgi:signal transduction histidine kinase
LHVEDNGRGFDTGPLRRGETGFPGVGLLSIRKRVDATGGTLTLESSGLRGTVIGAEWALAPAARDPESVD